LLRFLLALPPPTPFYTLSLHDALPIFAAAVLGRSVAGWLGLGQRTIIEPLTAGMSGPRANAIHTAADLGAKDDPAGLPAVFQSRSEEHTSELQSRENLVCRLLLEKKKQ